MLSIQLMSHMVTIFAEKLHADLLKSRDEWNEAIKDVPDEYAEPLGLIMNKYWQSLGKDCADLAANMLEHFPGKIE